MIFGLSPFEFIVTALSAIALGGSAAYLTLEQIELRKTRKKVRRIARKIEEVKDMRGLYPEPEDQTQVDLLYELYDSFKLTHYVSDDMVRYEVKHALRLLLSEEKEKAESE